MSTANEYTAAKLRELRAEGKLNGRVDDETARELLKTPPTSSIRSRELASKAKLDAEENSLSTMLRQSENQISEFATQPIALLAQHITDDCSAFVTAMEDNTRLAKEQMQRSLLQLFEDTAREKLADAFQRVGAHSGDQSLNQSGGGLNDVSTGSGVAAVRSKRGPTTIAASMVGRQSRRPVDRGLDKRDVATDFVIPEAVREHMNTDILLVVDHEMKRWLNVITGDINKILEQVLGVKERLGQMEEQVMQRQAENDMQAEQLAQYATETAALQSALDETRAHNIDKDRQMDLLRDQVSRRDASLDETRVRFRREVMRYKARQYELEMELEGLSNNRHGAGRGGRGERRMSMPDMASGDTDGDIRDEVFAAVETAVKDNTAKFEEEIKALKMEHAKEKRALLTEMHAKLAERDSEILRLKDRLKALSSKMPLSPPDSTPASPAGKGGKLGPDEPGPGAALLAQDSQPFQQ